MTDIKNKLVELLNTCPVDGIGTRVKHTPELYQAVAQITHGRTISEKIFCIVNDISNAPTCLCGKSLGFVSIKLGYRDFCSRTCDYAKKAATERRVAVLKERGGIGLANPESKRKAQETNQARYGVTNPFLLEKVLDLHKDYNPMKDPKVVQKLRDDCMEQYGVDWHSKRPDIIKAQQKTSLEKYGVVNPSQQSYSDETKAALFDPDILRDLFNNNAISEMAKKLDVSETTVLKYLRLFDIRQPNEIAPEVQIKTFLQNLGFDDFVKTRKILPSGQELDLYSQSHNLAVEHHGLYYHSQKFQTSNYHVNKYHECKNKGIKLISIFGDEWINKQDIVKMRLKHILGRSQTGPSGRQLSIIKVSPNEARKFFDQYHISGYRNSAVRYAAVDKAGNWAGAMSFGKPQKSKKGLPSIEWEMMRFATDGNNHPGLAAKLFQTFVRDQNPSSVLSYADLRWGEGNYLSHLGFERSEDTVPGYWYINLNSQILARYHRRRFTKAYLLKMASKLSITGNSEYELAKAMGLERIYDCGHATWIWQK